MHPYALQDRCSERLRGIEIPRPFSIDVFAAAVAERRGRALRILPLPGLDGSDGLSGAWVATDTTDYVLIDADASPWHRDLIGLHEIRPRPVRPRDRARRAEGPSRGPAARSQRRHHPAGPRPGLLQQPRRAGG